ncbi:MAG: 8-oxoguanine deaminase [Deltaproteobacteria bacterium]|nr:8-oxoguanine deaminase [Deltaproteobacteria bacterium]
MAGYKHWIRNADVVVTMDADRSELTGADILMVDGRIESVGAGGPEDSAGWEVIDAGGCVVTPALVNTHHHLFQTLTRAVPACQDASLFGWLRSLYPVWARMRPEDMFVSTQLGLAELALSGCGMSSDHLYLYPDGVRLEDTIEAAGTVGLRFHPTRGAMSVGESSGGLPPDNMTEREADIIEDCIRVIDAFHDPSEGAMVRVGIAPCSPFSVSRELMRDAAALAADKGVRLHTHLAENAEDVAWSLDNIGCRPGEYAESLGWVGEHVWHAHCVQLDPSEIALFARTGTGVAHCPSSNCRLGSGIAPVRAMRDAGVAVGLGVDGSASNDSGSLLPEARQAMMLQRVRRGAAAMSAREALELATLGGATVLGRACEIGTIEPGKRADLAIWDVSGLGAAGAWDPVAALMLCGPFTVRDLLVEGRPVVHGGVLTTVDTVAVAEAARRCVERLAA